MTKFRVVMKDADGIYDAIEEAAVDEVNKIRGLSQAERVQLVLARRNAIELDCEHWFEPASTSNWRSILTRERVW